MRVETGVWDQDLKRSEADYRTFCSVNLSVRWDGVGLGSEMIQVRVSLGFPNAGWDPAG